MTQAYKSVFLSRIEGVANTVSGSLTEVVASAFIDFTALASGDDSKAHLGTGINVFILDLIASIPIMALSASIGAAMTLLMTWDLAERNLHLTSIDMNRLEMASGYMAPNV